MSEFLNGLLDAGINYIDLVRSTTARRGGRSRSTTRSASSTISAKKGSCASLACRGSCRTCPNRSRWGSSTRSDPVLGTRSRARGAVHCRFGGGSRDDHPWRSGARCRRPGRLRVRSVPRGRALAFEQRRGGYDQENLNDYSTEWRPWRSYCGSHSAIPQWIQRSSARHALRVLRAL